MEAGTVRKETASYALKHPLAVQILTVANEYVISPSIFIDRFMRPAPVTERDRQNALSKASHHFHELVKRGAMEEVAIRPVRGAVEHFYRGTARAHFGDEEWEKLSPELRRKISTTTFQGLVARTEDAMLQHTFDRRTDRWLAWTAAKVDEQGWEEMLETLAANFEALEQIRKESEERLEDTDWEGTIPVTFAMLGFESPEMADPPEEAGQGPLLRLLPEDT